MKSQISQTWREWKNCSIENSKDINIDNSKISRILENSNVWRLWKWKFIKNNFLFSRFFLQRFCPRRSHKPKDSRLFIAPSSHCSLLNNTSEYNNRFYDFISRFKGGNYNRGACTYVAKGRLSLTRFFSRRRRKRANCKRTGKKGDSIMKEIENRGNQIFLVVRDVRI